MVNIEIYTRVICSYCHRAKALFTRKQVPFQEIPIDDDVDLREKMIKRSGRITAPQILLIGSMWAVAMICTRLMRVATWVPCLNKQKPRTRCLGARNQHCN